MIFFDTCRDKLPLIVAIPDFRRSAETSLSTTSKPARAATCAMPLPIWPEPITPTFLIITAISFLLPARTAHRLCYRINTGRPALLRPAAGILLAQLGQRFGQFGNRLIQIRDQAIVGDLE